MEFHLFATFTPALPAAEETSRSADSASFSFLQWEAV